MKKNNIGQPTAARHRKAAKRRAKIKARPQEELFNPRKEMPILYEMRKAFKGIFPAPLRYKYLNEIVKRNMSNDRRSDELDTSHTRTVIEN